MLDIKNITQIYNKSKKFHEKIWLFDINRTIVNLRTGKVALGAGAVPCFWNSKPNETLSESKLSSSCASPAFICCLGPLPVLFDMDTDVEHSMSSKSTVLAPVNKLMSNIKTAKKGCATN